MDRCRHAPLQTNCQRSAHQRVLVQAGAGRLPHHWFIRNQATGCQSVQDAKEALEQARRWGLIARSPANDATPPRHVRPEVTPPTVDEVVRILDKPVPADELQRAKDNLKGGLMLSLEGSGSRMSQLARNEIYFRRTVSADETLKKIDAVTSEEVTDLARKIFGQPQTLAIIGNLTGSRLKVPTLG